VPGGQVAPKTRILFEAINHLRYVHAAILIASLRI